MRTHREVWEPCVVYPHADGRPDSHIIHGTELRARRNAAIAAVYGCYYHRHVSTQRTLWGWLTRA